MSRTTSLLLQLTTLLLVLAFVIYYHDRIWGVDSVMMVTGLVAVALTAITTNQIVISLRASARRAAPAPRRAVPVHEGPRGMSPTQRFTNAARADIEEQLKRERAERNRLNIEADLKRMKGEAEW